MLDRRHVRFPGCTAHEMTLRWANGDPEARDIIDKVLASAGLTIDAVRVHTLAKFIDEFERIDRITMMAEGRRDSFLREIERHRAGFARRLRRAVDDAEKVEDAEFKVIAPAETEGYA